MSNLERWISLSRDAVGAFTYDMAPIALGRARFAAMCFVVAISSGAVAAGGDTPKYTGPGSCSAVSCHGSVQLRPENGILQNEYTTWTISDKHSRAAAALTGDIGKRIGRILRINPEKSPKCLDCHALNVQEEQKARTFDTNEGVSCESCHGPASSWLGPHTTRDWNHARSVELGMVDTKDPLKRSETCLGCHLGTASKWVDHEMIAAGHPDLYFEIDSFVAAMPKHWKERRDDPWSEVRVLAAGQAVQLRENMRRIARESERFWPEFSEFDCFACHHNLTGKTSWRQEHGYPGRRPGNPAWDSSRFAILKLIVEQVDGEDIEHLDVALSHVNSLVSDITADRHRIAAAAQTAAGIADRIAHRLAGFRFDSPTALQLIKRISSAADPIAFQGERSAEQAAMVLNSLVVAYCEKTKPAATSQAQMKAAVSALFHQVENQSAYNPTSFANQMRALNSLVR
jgi:hypothetical protein